MWVSLKKISDPVVDWSGSVSCAIFSVTAAFRTVSNEVTWLKSTKYWQISITVMFPAQGNQQPARPKPQIPQGKAPWTIHRTREDQPAKCGQTEHKLIFQRNLCSYQYLWKWVLKYDGMLVCQFVVQLSSTWRDFEGCKRFILTPNMMLKEWTCSESLGPVSHKNAQYLCR